MTLGLALSRERWFWAVLASFLVFTNTNSRGDTAMKASCSVRSGRFSASRSAWCLALLSGQMAAVALAVTEPVYLLAFCFLQTSYATMTFFVSIALCLVYGMIGSLTVDLLLLRIEETVLGRQPGRLSPSSSSRRARAAHSM